MAAPPHGYTDYNKMIPTAVTRRLCLQRARVISRRLSYS